MISTNIVTNIEEVPDKWVFEYYLKLSEKLDGQDVKMKSIFNPSDTIPSLYVFFSHEKNTYMVRDFATGFGGNGLELVKQLHKLENNWVTMQKVMQDYNKFIKEHGRSVDVKIEVEERYKVKDFTIRNWNNLDASYWGQYKIGSNLLEKYNISALEDFTLTKPSNEFQVKTPRMYGYFRKDGSLYKIYQPGRETKFFKVASYIQGVDQLTFKKSYLIICSSLKDCLAFLTLGIGNAEVIAPDSENIMLPERIIKLLKDKYKKVITVFDNDEAGYKSMLEYKKIYDLDFAHFKFEKDLADCIMVHGVKNTRELLYPVLKKALSS